MNPGNQITVDRQNLVELVRKWGNVNTDALLNKACQIFTIPEIEGFIGYKIKSSHAVVFGDPVCAPENQFALAKAFDEECQRMNLGLVYTMVSKNFVDWASDNLSAIAIEFGTNFVFDPHHNPTHRTGHRGIILRNKIKQALKNGVAIKEYLGDDPQIEKQMEAVTENWLHNRHGVQVYLSPLSLFEDRYGKRWFYAIKDDRIIGLLILNELQSQRGWLLNNVMWVDHSPKGLSELLIISTLETLDLEGCRYVLAGPVPSKLLGSVTGVSQATSNFIRFIYKIARYLFQLGEGMAFWNKFQPEQESSFLLFPHKNLRISSIKAILQALNASKV